MSQLQESHKYTTWVKRLTVNLVITGIWRLKVWIAERKASGDTWKIQIKQIQSPFNLSFFFFGIIRFRWERKEIRKYSQIDVHFTIVYSVIIGDINRTQDTASRKSENLPTMRCLSASYTKNASALNMAMNVHRLT